MQCNYNVWLKMARNEVGLQSGIFSRTLQLHIAKFDMIEVFKLVHNYDSEAPLLHRESKKHATLHA